MKLIKLISRKANLLTAVLGTVLTIAIAIASVQDTPTGNFATNFDTPLMFGLWCLLCILGTVLVIRSKRVSQYNFILMHAAVLVIIIGYTFSVVLGDIGNMNIRKGQPQSGYISSADGTAKPFPFELSLVDFQTDFYPSTKTPLGYQAELAVKAPAIGQHLHLKMNQPAGYAGYKFFIANYDMPSQVLTLRVKYDVLGTLVSYLGFLLLTLSFVVSFFDKNSRIRYLVARIKKLKSVAAVALLLAISSLPTQAAKAFDTRAVVPQEYASLLTELWSQDGHSRFKPLSTICTEIAHKITGTHRFQGLSAEQVALSIVLYQNAWKTYPIFKVSDKKLRQELGMKGGYCSFEDNFDAQGQYRLEALVKEAHQTAKESEFERALMTHTEKLNIFIMLVRSEFFKIFPSKNEQLDAWHFPNDSLTGYAPQEKAFVNKALLLFFDAVLEHNLPQAQQTALGIQKYQELNSKHPLPSATKRSLEIHYNRTDVFAKFRFLYLFVGLLLLIVSIFKLYTERGKIRYFDTAFFYLLCVAVLVHLVYIGIRSYISGYMSMSNGYEAMVYISFLGALASLFFYSKQPILTASGMIFSALSLMVANISWMNPEITNLVPVLQSTWLSIHVSLMMSAYSLAGIASLVCCILLVSICISRKTNTERILHFWASFKHYTEFILWISLYFMAVGIITGGIWADQSWGNYWSWDPKETWALISLMVYAGILHKFKKLKSVTAMFVVFVAYGAVLITYFGVNYYFGGMHSYAKGENVDLLLETVLYGAVVALLYFIPKWKLQRIKQLF